MAEDVGVVITGAREVDLQFEEGIPQAIHERLLSQVVEFTARLEGAVLSRIPRRTGKLASEVTKSVLNTPDRIVGTVGVSAEFAKAGALEYGAHRAARLRAHTMRLTHVFGDRLTSPLTVMVEAHTRQLDLAERRFERGPFEQMEPEIEAGLREAVSEGIGAAQ